MLLQSSHNFGLKIHKICQIFFRQIRFCSQFTKCDRILENNSKSHMKSSVFLHVFNDISTYM